MPLFSRKLLLLGGLAPALLAGCATTETSTPVPVVSYDLGPDDTPLPETVAVLPSQSTGEPVVALASYIEAPEASQALAAAAGAVGVAPTSPEAIAQGQGQAPQTGEGASAVAAGEVALPDGAMVPVPSAKAGAGVMVASLAADSEIVEAALAPASFVRQDDPRGQIDQLIAKYSAVYEVPVDLVRRVVKRESNFDPSAFSRGHYGLMQIKHATARGMGYLGPAHGLFDAETNLRYAVKYLRGAYLVADGDHDRADRLYQRGYYYDAKRLGLLEETGLGTDRVRRRQPQL